MSQPVLNYAAPPERRCFDLPLWLVQFGILTVVAAMVTVSAFFFVPRVLAICKDFKLGLSAFTILVLSVCGRLADGWNILGLWVMPIGVPTLVGLCGRPRNRQLAMALSIVFGLLLILAVATALMVALSEPWLRLMEPLIGGGGKG